MNLIHRWLCRSKRRKDTVDTYQLPWTLKDIDLGQKATAPLLPEFLFSMISLVYYRVPLTADSRRTSQSPGWGIF
jgi:hypothetical protein